MENSQNKELKVKLKALEKISKHTQWGRRQQEIMKLRSEVNQLEIMGTIKRINKTKRCLFEKIHKIAFRTVWVVCQHLGMY